MINLLVLGFWETAHLPLPYAIIITKWEVSLTSHLGQNVGLGEG